MFDLMQEMLLLVYERLFTSFESLLNRLLLSSTAFQQHEHCTYIFNNKCMHYMYIYLSVRNISLDQSNNIMYVLRKSSFFMEAYMYNLRKTDQLLQ